MDRSEIAKVSLLRAPLVSARTFALVVAEGVASLIRYMTSNALTCAAVAATCASLIGALYKPPSGFEAPVAFVSDHASFIAYWVTLGVLSSVGLGSGLHTFVLFLGPHILRIANAAVMHGNTGETERVASRGDGQCKLITTPVYEFA